MGKLILCTGKMAEHPLSLPWITQEGRRVWSVEELCLYVERNLENVERDFYDSELTEWLRTECGMPETADKLDALREKGNGSRDLAVALWCATDYYTEQEILELMKKMRELESLPPWRKRKKKADHMLQSGAYERARAEYEAVLAMPGLTQEDSGNLCHNIGVAQLHTAEAAEAAGSFYLAYKQNRNPESLKECLFAWRLAGREEEFRKVAEEEEAGEEFMDMLENEWDRSLPEAENSPELAELRRIREEPEETQAQKALRALSDGLREEYRRGIQG